MKTKLLFIMSNLACGGAEKALISLLGTLDYERFEVDLMLFKHEGLFMNSIPDQVRLLPEPEGFRYFDMPVMRALADCIRKGRLHLIFPRIIGGFIIRSEPNAARREQRMWKYLAKAMPVLSFRYDAAIGFLEKNPIYYCVEKVNARRKIGFIHTDYQQMGMDASLDMMYFEKLDAVMTVSETCADVLRSLFPMYDHKIRVMQNILSPVLIRKLSRGNMEMKDEGIQIVSVGRLTELKGFDLAVQACRLLLDWGYRLTWTIIGDGEEKLRLTKQIQELQLDGIVKLVGLKQNPYPFIKAADVYVQPSRFEGKSIAIDEAKILHKPIVTTNFSTAKDQISHEKNGLIVEMKPESLAKGIKRLLDDKQLSNNFTRQLSSEELGTELEIIKMYALLT